MRTTSNKAETDKLIIPGIGTELNGTIEINGKRETSVSFSGEQDHCCVAMVDIVNSTKISASLSSEKLCKYYSMFLNSMAAIARQYEAKVVKNIGDSILFYFPKSCHSEKQICLHASLECCLAITEIHDLLNKKLVEQNLPRLDYRVSADYGPIMIAKSDLLQAEDIFGLSVNMCSKINHYAQKNSVIIGGDLYELVKKLPEYKFKTVEAFDIGLKNKYPSFQLARKKSTCSELVQKVKEIEKIHSEQVNVKSKVTAMAIEAALRKIGLPEYEIVTTRLATDYHSYLFDCFTNPHCLKNVLMDIYGKAYTAVIDKIYEEIDPDTMPQEEKEQFLTILRS